MRVIAVSLLAFLLGALPLRAQAPDVEGLFSDDWRVRNETARALLTAPSKEIDHVELVRALATEAVTTQWRSSIGLGGGVGPFPNQGPRKDVTDAAANIIRRNRFYSSYQFPDSPASLVVPWETSELAAYIIREHVRRGARWERDLANIEPATRETAEAWLLSKPDEASLLATIADPRYGSTVAEQLATDRKSGHEALRLALRKGTPLARRHVFSTCEDVCNAPDLIRIAVETFLAEDEENYRPASYAVFSLGADAIVEVARQCDGELYQRHRALAMLTVLREHAAPAANTLAEQIGDDPFSTHQALVTLASIELDEQVQAKVAAAAMKIVESSDEVAMRILALDALANCPNGVNEQQIAALQEKLPVKTSFFTRYAQDAPRLLSCLHRLGSVPDLPLKSKLKLAIMRHANSDTWLALAAHDKEGFETFLKHARSPFASELKKLAEAAVAIDKAVVLEHLSGRKRALHPFLMRALLDRYPDSMSNDELFRLATTAKASHPDVARSAAASLADRPGAETYARRILDANLAAPPLPHDVLPWVEKLDMKPTELLEYLAPTLRLGENWDTVEHLDRSLRRERCREWLRAGEGKHREKLVRVLVELGIETDADTSIVIAAIDTDRRMIYALADAEQLPEKVLDALRERVDAPTKWNWDAQRLRSILIDHAERAAK